jgi:hypothetical protein
MASKKVLTKSNLIRILEKAQKMGYFKNDAASGGKDYNRHEDAFEDLVKSEGFVRSKTKKVSKAQKDKIVAKNGKDEDKIMKDGEYIPQPCGTHASPDFMIKVEGKIYFIECKSAKGKEPTYNSGVPCPICVYIFCSKKENKTTVYMGHNVAGKETVKKIEEIDRKIQSLLEKENEELRKIRDNLGGLDYYDRKMLNHRKTGTPYRVAYFDPPIRADRFENVKSFVLNS